MSAGLQAMRLLDCRTECRLLVPIFSNNWLSKYQSCLLNSQVVFSRTNKRNLFDVDDVGMFEAAYDVHLA